MGSADLTDIVRKGYEHLDDPNDLEIQKALIGLGIKKAPKPNGMGEPGIPLPEKQRAPKGENLAQLSKRLQAERAEEIQKQRLEFHDRQYTTHMSIAMEHARAYDELEHRNGGG